MTATMIALHNLQRYVVIAFALWAFWRAFSGLLAKGGWLPADERARRLFPVMLDVQFLLGVVVYIFSGVGQALVQDPGGTMSNGPLRFYAVEHVAMAVFAMAFAHVGSARARKAKKPRDKFKAMLLWHSLALVAILSRMPWDRWLPWG